MFNADFLHAILGVVFTSIWLFVGQIVASDR
jgi:hypothetical protein